MNVFLVRMNTGEKLSDAEYEKGKQTIVSAELTLSEFEEIDGILDSFYAKFLSQKK